MSLVDGAERTAVCANRPECENAAAGTLVEWYRGAGEYCPVCGEALEVVGAGEERPASAARRGDDRVDALPTHDVSDVADVAVAPPAPPDHPAATFDRATSPPERRTRTGAPLRWIWLLVAAFLAGAAMFAIMHRIPGSVRSPTNALTVCPAPSARGLAGDLIRAYAAKNRIDPHRFVIADDESCDVRFSTSAETPDAVIARDGIVAIVNPLNPIPRISERELRAIYHGVIRDWSQLGGPRGPIFPLLPADAADEARALASTLFFDTAIDRGVRRGGTSADVTRAVTGADRTSRGAIGMVAFSQAVPAKVVPLAYLPPPSVLTIATRRYPYTLSIAVESPAEPEADAAGLVEYARSNEGAQIVAKDGLVNREGF